MIVENGIFSFGSVECPLDKINNVACSQSILGRIIGFGNVEIQTAAGHGATVYINAKHPQLLKERITTMQGEYKKFNGKEEAKAYGNLLLDAHNNSDCISVATELEKIFQLKEKGALTDEEFQNIKIILNT